jgi:hypothetical protein
MRVPNGAAFRFATCNHENRNNSPMCVFTAHTAMIGAAEHERFLLLACATRTPWRTKHVS